MTTNSIPCRFVLEAMDKRVFVAFAKSSEMDQQGPQQGTQHEDRRPGVDCEHLSQKFVGYRTDPGCCEGQTRIRLSGFVYCLEHYG